MAVLGVPEAWASNMDSSGTVWEFSLISSSGFSNLPALEGLRPDAGTRRLASFKGRREVEAIGLVAGWLMAGSREKRGRV
jgi:hypothetical protein